MALTNNKKLAEKMRILRTNGISQLNFLFKKNKILPWYYEHITPGFNYRINDIQCALGLSQLRKLKKFLDKRLKIAKFYDKKFNKIKGINLYQ